MIPCTTSSDCVDITNGCCLASIIESMADDSQFGLLVYMWNEDGTMPEAGEQNNACTDAHW